MKQFEGQIAGHPGILRQELDDWTIFKPENNVEFAFYEQLPFHELSKFTPKMYGVLRLVDQSNQTGEQGHSQQEQSYLRQEKSLLQQEKSQLRQHEQEQQLQMRTQQLQRLVEAQSGLQLKRRNEGNEQHSESENSYIVLQNLLSGFSRPSAMDIKIGQCTYESCTPLAKRLRQEARAKASTSFSCALRIAGARIWNPQTEQYNIFGREWGYNVKPETLDESFYGLFKELEPTARTAVLNALLTQTDELLDILERTEVRMFGASLLVIFEGDPHSMQVRMNRSRNQMPKTSNDREDPDKFAADPIDTANAKGHRKDFETANKRSSEANNDLDADASRNIVIAGDLAEDASEDGSDESDISTTSTSSADDQEAALWDVAIVRLIDFVHSRWQPGDGKDPNVIGGVQSFKRRLENAIKTDNNR